MNIDRNKKNKQSNVNFEDLKSSLEIINIKEVKNIKLDKSKYSNDLIEPLISIIIRTYNKRNALREALTSIRNQTYKNIEVVICEDGNNSAQEMLETEFEDLNIVYTYTKENVGRSLAGNIALSLSTGAYLNFLDDDDILYPDHIETLINEFIIDRNLDMVHATAFETPITIISLSPYRYIVHDKKIVFSIPFSKNILFQKNQFPIQTVMFKRELYEKFGGFNTNYDFLEDWDLWLKYFFNISSKFVNKTTSEYRVPHNRRLSKKRRRNLKKNFLLIQSIHFKNYFGHLLSGEVFDIEKIAHSIKFFELNYIKNNLILFGSVSIENYNSEYNKIYLVLQLDDKEYIMETDLVDFKNLPKTTCNEKFTKTWFYIEKNIPDYIIRDIQAIKLVLKNGPLYEFYKRDINQLNILKRIKLRIIKQFLKLYNKIRKIFAN